MIPLIDFGKSPRMETFLEDYVSIVLQVHNYGNHTRRNKLWQLEPGRLSRKNFSLITPCISSDGGVRTETTSGESALQSGCLVSTMHTVSQRQPHRNYGSDQSLTNCVCLPLSVSFSSGQLQYHSAWPDFICPIGLVYASWIKRFPTPQTRDFPEIPFFQLPLALTFAFPCQQECGFGVEINLRGNEVMFFFYVFQQFGKILHLSKCCVFPEKWIPHDIQWVTS